MLGSKPPISAVAADDPHASTLLDDLLELTKLRLNMMVLVTIMAGYVLAAGDLRHITVIASTLIGTCLAGFGASALNQYLEIDTDRLMPRTANRPLPSGRISASHALTFGVVLAIIGVLLLTVMVSPLCGLLCALTVAVYLFAYTPLKRLSPINTFIGAIPGAIPPMIGWAAASDDLSVGAWILFAILFMWQLPHFYAIAWMYRDDYLKADLKMVSQLDDNGLKNAQHLVMCVLNLVFVSTLPTVVGLAGTLYFSVVVALGAGLLLTALNFLHTRSTKRAKLVMFGSLLYLPLVLFAWIVDTAW